MLVLKSSSPASHGTFRRFTTEDDISFGSLVEILAKLHYPGQSGSRQFSVSYEDDERDQVDVSSDAELREAIRLVRLSANAAAGSASRDFPTLKLFVKELDETATPKDTHTEGGTFGCSSGDLPKCFTALAELFNESPDAQQICRAFVSSISPLLERAIESKRGTDTNLEQHGPLLLSLMRRFDQRESGEESQQHESFPPKLFSSEPDLPPSEESVDLREEDEETVSEAHCPAEQSPCNSQSISSSVIATFMEESLPAEEEAAQSEFPEDRARDGLMSESMAEWEVLPSMKSSVTSTCSSEGPAVAFPATSIVHTDEPAAVETTSDVGRSSVISSVSSSDDRVMRFNSQLLQKMITLGRPAAARMYLLLFTKPDLNLGSMFEEIDKQISLEARQPPVPVLLASRERLLRVLPQLQLTAGLSDFPPADLPATPRNSLQTPRDVSKGIPSASDLDASRETLQRLVDQLQPSSVHTSAPASSAEPEAHAGKIFDVLGLAEDNAEANEEVTLPSPTAAVAEPLVHVVTSLDVAGGAASEPKSAAEASPESSVESSHEPAASPPLDAANSSRSPHQAALEAAIGSPEAAVEPAHEAAVGASDEAVVDAPLEAGGEAPVAEVFLEAPSAAPVVVEAPSECVAEASVDVTTTTELAEAAGVPETESLPEPASEAPAVGPSPVDTTNAPPVPSSSSWSSGRKPFNASFVEDVTLEDGCHVPAGVTAAKVWLVRNSGQNAWMPGDIFLVCTEGAEDFGFRKDVHIPLDTVVLPGQQHELRVDMLPARLPSPITRHIRSTWQLFSASARCRFGHKLWADIVATPTPAAFTTVPADHDAATAVTEAPGAGRSDSGSDSDSAPVPPAAPEAAHVPPPPVPAAAIDEAIAQEPEPIPHAPEPSLQPLAPPQPPSLDVDVDLDSLQEKLFILSEMGFTDAEGNMQLLLDLNGDVNIAVNVLLSSML